MSLHFNNKTLLQYKKNAFVIKLINVNFLANFLSSSSPTDSGGESPTSPIKYKT